MSLDKFKKALEKKGFEVEEGYSEVPQWYSFPTYAMNWVATGRFQKGCPAAGRSVFLGGASGSSKSLQLLYLVKQALEDDRTVIYLDSEGALDRASMKDMGIDPDHPNFFIIPVDTIEEVTTIFAEMVKEFDPEDRLMIMLDSASGLSNENEAKTLEGGKLQADQGRQARLMKGMIRAINKKIKSRNWGFVAISQTYTSQDMYASALEKEKFSNMGVAIYYPSIVLLLRKKAIKDSDGDIGGINVTCQCYKSRFSTVGRKTDFNLTYKDFINKNDGVLQILVKEGYVYQSGAWYSYEKDINGEIETIKFQSKNLPDHVDYLIKKYDSDKGEISEEDRNIEPEED